MYTDHLLNSHEDVQVSIFKILNTENEYMFGWEDLNMSATAGDRDYQDMIVRVMINSVLEPTMLMLIGMALVGVLSLGARRKTRV